MNPKLTEAREFLEKKDDGTPVFEVEWTQKVTWYVAAASKEEAEKAAKDIGTRDLDFDDPDVYVSEDLTAAAKKHAEKLKQECKPPDADSGVFKGEIIHVNEYFAQRVWHLICEKVGNSMACVECGHEDWVSEFNLNPEPVKYGHIPIMGCPECKAPIDWVALMGEEKKADDKTLPMFGEEGEADGVQGREED